MVDYFKSTIDNTFVSTQDNAWATLYDIESVISLSTARYKLVLSGSPDIEIPINTFTGRLRDGEPTYLQVTIPDVNWAEEIATRSDGELKIDLLYVYGGEVIKRGTIATADLETIRVDKGGTNKTITLSGHKTTSFTPGTLDLTNSTYRRLSGGKIMHRLAAPDFDLTPGSTVNISGDTFIVGLISYTVSADYKNIEITEA